MRVCTICTHNQRAEIDRELIQGETLRDIAARFSLSMSALSRHRRHISSAIAAAEVDAGLNTVSEIRAALTAVYRRVAKLTTKLEAGADHRTTLAGYRESVRTLSALLATRPTEEGRTPDFVVYMENPDGTTEEVRRIPGSRPT